jgi:hypothetical protein
VWTLRALHASPRLAHIRLESHRYVTDRLVDACLPHLPGVERDLLWQRLRLAVELGFAADAMLHEEDRLPRDAVLGDVTMLLRTALLDFLTPPPA